MKYIIFQLSDLIIINHILFPETMLKFVLLKLTPLAQIKFYEKLVFILTFFMLTYGYKESFCSLILSKSKQQFFLTRNASGPVVTAIVNYIRLHLIVCKISFLKCHLILFPVLLFKKVINELTIIKHE